VSDQTTRAECRECSECGHAGINDMHQTVAACLTCGWSGPEPVEDHCPACDSDGTMTAACPKCCGRYTLIAEAQIAALSPDVSAYIASLVAENAALREALTELVATHTEPAGASVSMFADKEEFSAFIDRCESRVAAAVDAARKALSAKEPT
jgi:hypothetical protein